MGLELTVLTSYTSVNSLYTVHNKQVFSKPWTRNEQNSPESWRLHPTVSSR